jgi:hypothetical protein
MGSGLHGNSRAIESLSGSGDGETSENNNNKMNNDPTRESNLPNNVDAALEYLTKKRALILAGKPVPVLGKNIIIWKATKK